MSSVFVTLPVPVLLALAVFVAGWALHVLTTVPPMAKLRISPGLASVPPGPEKELISRIYPEDLFGPDGSYVSLPYGVVKYALSGPKDGRKVVLIHGLSVPSVIFKDVASLLVRDGFYVLTYDLYGRGYSDAPEVPHSARLYTTQLALLLQYLGWSNTRVVGLSMGGGIAASFVAQFPQLVDRDIVFIAPAGNFPDDYFSRGIGFLVSSPVQFLLGFRFIRTLRKLPAPPRTKLHAVSLLVNLQFRNLPHFIRVIASSVRSGPMRGLGQVYRTVGRGPFKVLIIHGTADETVPYRPFISPILTDLIPDAKVVTLENVGHDLVITHYEEVGRR
ncbi:hypothetical protein BS47DRAFT_605439 [Hydnum rufescens UP504]|uniref:AB hydrolase-1 domain-containing protein n=1 Tax=Hydnum rufescens UP504 TaxID=1448309 RepID=A0A9P6E0A3_9AGAM|nr:hypothetical protein BS47DRAFT_605439 [Hydnum rufescens UP504]